MLRHVKLSFPPCHFIFPLPKNSFLSVEATQTEISGMSTKFSYLFFVHLCLVFSSDTTQPTPSSAPRKKPSKKATKSNGQNGNNNSSYEHHLEKWLENTSKMNFDCSNLDSNWPFMNAPNAFQQQPTNRKGNSHLHQYGSNDPISLPSQVVSFCDF